MLSTLAINVNLIVSTVSWVAIHPYHWFTYGWDTPAKVSYQFYLMVVHTVPMLFAAINFMFLTDATMYISDVWVLFLVTILYMMVNYHYYHTTGDIYYLFMDWSKPDEYWIIALVISVLFVLSLISNTTISLISQAVVGRYEWNGNWLQYTAE